MMIESHMMLYPPNLSPMTYLGQWDVLLVLSFEEVVGSSVAVADCYCLPATVVTTGVALVQLVTIVLIPKIVNQHNTYQKVWYITKLLCGDQCMNQHTSMLHNKYPLLTPKPANSCKVHSMLSTSMHMHPVLGDLICDLWCIHYPI